MDHHIKEFFRQSSDQSSSGHFHKVVALHDAPDIDWKSISKLVPNLPRGWFELAQLKTRDRIEFTRDYWLTKLPYHPNLQDCLMRFFAALDDVAIFATQKKFDDPFEPQMVYSLKDDSGFYRGGNPASEEDILKVQKSFSSYILPVDYLAFLQIHDGFWKTTDCTGLIKSSHLYENYQQFQEMLAEGQPVSTTKGDQVDAKSLIPFYESFGMPYYQCFWAEWYPENEMGNVYYSGNTKTISDVQSNDPMNDTMAFPSFTDWLIFYLERIS